MRTTTAPKKLKGSRTKRRTPRAAARHQEAPVSTSPSTETPAAEESVVKESVSTPAAAAPESTPQIAVPVAGRPAAVGARPRRLRAMMLAGIAALAVAVIALPRHLAPVHAPGAADARPEANEPSSDPVSTAQPGVATATPGIAHAPERASAAVLPVHVETRDAGEAPKRKPVPAQNPAAKPSSRVATESSAWVPTVAPVVEARVTETPEARPTHTEPIGTAPASAPPAPAAAVFAPDTITGCLEVSVDGDRFRLTDTEGTSAPKARSWRTGFLKRRAAPVDLVGNSDVLALRQQVGKRVAVSGVQTSRELEVRSVRVVSPSCD